MNVLLASKVGTSSLLVDLVSNDSGDVTLVTEDGSVTTNRLLLFLSIPSLQALDCLSCCNEPLTFLLAERTSAQVRRALLFLVQCGDVGPLMNILGVYLKEDKELKDDDGGAEDTSITPSPIDYVQNPPNNAKERTTQASSLWNNHPISLQRQTNQHPLPNHTLSDEKQDPSSFSDVGKQLNSHSDLLNREIDNAISAVMGGKIQDQPSSITAKDGDQEVKLEQEEPHLVEFFEEPEFEENDKKFAKANRRVYTLNKGLLRANRRVYNLPPEVQEQLICQNPGKQIDFTQTSHGGTLMLMDGYMLTGRVGVGSHKRVEDELFIIWTCLEVKNLGCRAKLTSKNGQFVVTWAEKHNHAANKDGFEKRKAKTDLINAIVASGKSVSEFFGRIPVDMDKAGALGRRIKMLKKENRLLLNQTSKSGLESDLKLEELAKICGLAERNKKMEEEPARGRAKELPEEEKALMVAQNPGNRIEFGVNQQGGPTLLLDGFMYQVARVRAPISITKSNRGDPWHWMSWRCKHVVIEGGIRKRSKCKLQVNFTSGKISRQVDPSEHKHGPNEGEFHKIQAKRALLTKIIASGQTAHNYVRENNLPREILTENMVTMVRRARKENADPSMKADLHDRSAEDPMYHLRMSLQNQKARKWKEQQRQKKKAERLLGQRSEAIIS